jgi:hypothetical protein
MEFPELVHACSHRGCSEKNDFLPFTCDGCSKKFCLEHHRHEAHGCHGIHICHLRWASVVITTLLTYVYFPSAKPRDDKYVPVCPLCMQAIAVKPGDNVNNIVDQVRAPGPVSPPAQSNITHSNTVSPTAAGPGHCLAYSRHIAYINTVLLSM